MELYDLPREDIPNPRVEPYLQKYWNLRLVKKSGFGQEKWIWSIKVDCLSISYQVTPVEVGVHDDLRLKPPETLEYDFGWLEAFIGLS